MSYSFDKVNTDRWSELADGYQSMLDELKSDELESVFIPVSHFDELEIL
jgi:hypothetical protein